MVTSSSDARMREPDNALVGQKFRHLGRARVMPVGHESAPLLYQFHIVET
jgi:hypothetical protein